MSTGLSLVTERTTVDLGQPILNGGEELMRVQPRVSIVLDNSPPESPGTLYITNKRVIWLSDSDRGKGYSVDFLSISLHAVSTDPEAYPSPCIYAQACKTNTIIYIDMPNAYEEVLPKQRGKEFRQHSSLYSCDIRECVSELTQSEVSTLSTTFYGVIDKKIDTGTDGEESEESDSEYNEIDLSKVTEMRLVPSDPTQLDAMFQIFCECAELNPGPIDDNLDDEGEHNWVFSADQIESENGEVDEFDGIPQNNVNAIGSNGNHDLANRVLQLEINDQRFEDAEEELENGDTVDRHGH